MRCWIVGNGRSLNETPLELLEGEITFGVNRIHKFYDHISWRPTIYVRTEIDPLDYREVAVWHTEQGYKCFYANHIAHTVSELRKPDWPLDNVVAIKLNCEHLNSSHSYGVKPEGWHFPKLCCYGSVVNVAAQIAVLEGYNPIYLVGCDLGYDEKGVNHFDDDYGNWNEMNQSERNETEEYMHNVIKKECDQRGIEIFNATVGGWLEVYPRVDIREILNEHD